MGRTGVATWPAGVESIRTKCPWHSKWPMRVLSYHIPGYSGIISRFPNNPLIIRVPFPLIFNFNKETPK